MPKHKNPRINATARGLSPWCGGVVFRRRRTSARQRQTFATAKLEQQTCPAHPFVRRAFSGANTSPRPCTRDAALPGRAIGSMPAPACCPSGAAADFPPAVGAPAAALTLHRQLVGRCCAGDPRAWGRPLCSAVDYSGSAFATSCGQGSQRPGRALAPSMRGWAFSCAETAPLPQRNLLGRAPPREPGALLCVDIDVGFRGDYGAEQR
jgi:hypothetical protein